jgi:hypothetical protein
MRWPDEAHRKVIGRSEKVLIPIGSPPNRQLICSDRSSALVVYSERGQGQQQPWQVMATIDQADIRGSRPHNHDPSGAASDYYRESGKACRKLTPRVLLRACSGCG